MQELIKQHRQLDRVAKLYLISQFLRGLYFAWPIWYAFASQALNPVQIGLYFSVLYGVQLVAEVPTGAFADKYGRKRSALLGSLLLIAVPFIIYFGHSFPAYILGAIISGIGLAFISGSLDALVYDHKNVSKEAYRLIVWLEITFFQTGLILSAISGGFLYSIHHSLPWLAEGLAAILCFIVIALITESPIDTKTKLKESYTRYFKTGIKHLLATKYLRVIVLAGVPLSAMMTTCIEYINEAQMIEYGLEPSVRGLLIGGAKVLALIIINLVLFKLLRFDRSRLLFIAITGAVVFITLGIESMPLFLVIYLLFNWLSATQASFIQPIIQDNLPSSHRATTMSGYSALIGIVAVGGNALTGWVIQTFHTPRAVYLLFAVIFLIIVVPCIFWLMRHLKNSTNRAQADAA